MRIRIEHGHAATYISHPGGARPRIVNSVMAASEMQRQWRPPGLTRWQRLVCLVLMSGPSVTVSPNSGRLYYWPPRWLLGDTDGH